MLLLIAILLAVLIIVPFNLLAHYIDDVGMAFLLGLIAEGIYLTIMRFV